MGKCPANRNVLRSVFVVGVTKKGLNPRTFLQDGYIAIRIAKMLEIAGVQIGIMFEIGSDSIMADSTNGPERNINR